MAVIPTIRGTVKSIEDQDGYYQAKVVLTQVYKGWYGSKERLFPEDQTLMVRDREAIKCQVGDEVCVVAFSQAPPNTWEIEGVIDPSLTF